MTATSLIVTASVTNSVDEIVAQVAAVHVDPREEQRDRAREEDVTRHAGVERGKLRLSGEYTSRFSALSTWFVPIVNRR